MGRDKPKKYNKMGYQQKSLYHDKLAKDYNINKDDFNTAQGGGGGRYDNINEGAYKNAIENAIRNDVDYRRTAETGQLDGFKGDASIKDFVNYQRAGAKFHKNEQGNSGKWDSNKDITGTTQALVQDQERARAEDFKKMYMNDMNSVRDELETDKGLQDQATADPQSFEHSDAVSNAQENLDKYKVSLGDSDLFGKANEPAPRADDQKDATASFLGEYKTDVKDASDLGENVTSNLNNAINAASYRHRF